MRAHPVWRTGFARSLLALLGVAAVVGCTDSDGSPSRSRDAGLENLALAAPPDGYRESPRKVSGYLDDESAEASTPAPPTAVRAFVRRKEYEGAFARVWEQGEFYVQDLVFGFSDAATADEFLTMQVETLRGGATVPYPVSEIPGSTAFVLSGTTRAGARDVFCGSVWFAHEARVFLVQHCGDVPVPMQIAEELAIAQYQRAVVDTP